MFRFFPDAFKMMHQQDDQFSALIHMHRHIKNPEPDSGLSPKGRNEEYFFLTPAEGEIEEEVAAIMVEIKNGNISSMAVDEVDL